MKSHWNRRSSVVRKAVGQVKEEDSLTSGKVLARAEYLSAFCSSFCPNGDTFRNASMLMTVEITIVFLESSSFESLKV